MTNDIKSIIEHYGVEHQIKKAIEELRELIEVLKTEDAQTIDICQEIADVEIMIKQLRYIFDYGDCIDALIKFKLNRTLCIMNGECTVAKKDRPSFCGKTEWACRVCKKNK